MIVQESLAKKPDFKSIFLFPFFFILLLWLVEYIEWKYHFDFTQYGLYPRTFSGLLGIITSPLLHSDFNHLLSNSIPLFIMLGMMKHFYPTLTFKVFIIIYLLSTSMAWVFARPSYHIGASGIVYGLLVFFVISGIIRNNIQLAAVALLVLFLYGGGFLFGVLPLPSGLSWESHLSGALSGLLSALIFKSEGPQKTEYNWGEEDDENESDEWKESDQNDSADANDDPVIRWEIKP